ncbi:hypothetical protein M758_12G026800 [Ceratodon purpureus]|nr:hypothetical protein M758_12G026800 [Ceratodon purpureus]
MATTMAPKVGHGDGEGATSKGTESKALLEMVQLLVAQGVKQVPEKFIQPEHIRRTVHEVGAVSSDMIPVIDMAGLDGDNKDQVMADVAKACEEWGFFQVVNHGVPPVLMQEIQQVSKDFFALSPEEKEVNKIKPGTSVGYGRLFETGKTVANWVDRITIWSYGEQSRAEPCMPPKPERFRQVVDEYSEAVVKLCMRLIETLSTTLGLEPHILGEHINVKTVGLRTSFNYYPPCPQPELVLGIMPHADTSFVTVLQQDETPGLEIEKDGQWILVPPVKDAFVVNIGDLLQIVSNGKYRSVMHRVLVNNTVGRYSFPNFFMPPKETVIQPVKELLSETNPPLYRSLKFAEYISGFYVKPLTGRRLIDSFLLTPSES